MVAITREHKHAKFTRQVEPVQRQTPFPALHALLIGINKYKHFTPLSGAVKDLESVYDFLRFDLSVPESQITKLTNEEATRSGIIDAIERLSKDPSINRSDPILIFYAGHGCEVDSPLENYTEKAQCLVPWDTGSQGADGGFIAPLPDYTISALLNELASEKGNNITVILDSCHSASGTRGIRNSTKTESRSSVQFSSRRTPINHLTMTPKPAPEFHCRARSLNSRDIPPLTLEVDRDIIQRAERRRRWRTTIAFVRSHLLFKQMVTTPNSKEFVTEAAALQPPLEKAIPALLGFSRSHILLAACGHAELAYECVECNRGYFTAALLQVLRSSLLKNLRYKQCFEQFPQLSTPSPQNPVCEGDPSGRVFFAGPAPIMAVRAVSFTMEQFSEKFLVRLGDAQGVFPGSKYGIYEDCTHMSLASGVLPSPGLDRTLWGTFTAYPFNNMNSAHYPFYSQCQLDSNANIPSWPRAKLLELGRRGAFSLKVFVSEALRSVLDPDSIVHENQGMVRVDSVDPSTVILDIEPGNRGRVIFRLANSGVLYRCPPNPKRLHHILISMAQWRWHRSRKPSSEGTFDQKIWARLTMHELGHADPLPAEQGGSINVRVSPTALYALKVESFFSRRLYAYLFYFSTTRQSIRPLYLGVYGSSHIDPPLQPYGELTYGYNNDDMIPGALSFALPEDEGYLQLFLTTWPGDFDSVAQPSPFTNVRGPISTGNIDEFGDGLEVRRYHPLDPSDAERCDLPGTHSGGALGDYSTALIAARDFDTHISETQLMGTRHGLEDSLRASLSGSAAAEILAGIKLWSVVSLKVKCGRAGV